MSERTGAEVVRARRRARPDHRASHRQHAEGLSALLMSEVEHRTLGGLRATELEVLEVGATARPLAELDADLWWQRRASSPIELRSTRVAQGGCEGGARVVLT